MKLNRNGSGCQKYYFDVSCFLDYREILYIVALPSICFIQTVKVLIFRLAIIGMQSISSASVTLVQFSKQI